jgi:CRISPR-associated endonuclease/helicase Cas3
LVACTATQPALGPRRNGLTGQPASPGLGVVRPIIDDPRRLFHALARVTPAWPADPRTPTAWAALAAEVRALPRALVILHRRQDARAVAELLGDETFHLSAQMVPEHRSQVLATIKARLATPDGPCRVVATQLVEAGVDLDFPVVYRALAGVDALAQAAGRCNREGRLNRGAFRVFVAPTEPPPGVLRLARDVTLGLLAEGPLDLNDPDLYRRFYARLYDIADTDAKDIQALRAGLGTDFPAVAERYRLIEDGYQAAVVVPWPGLDDRTLDAIARLRAGGADPEAVQRARRATVTIPRAQLLEWATAHVVVVPPRCPIPIVDLTAWPSLYDARFGLMSGAAPEVAAAALVV